MIFMPLCTLCIPLVPGNCTRTDENFNVCYDMTGNCVGDVLKKEQELELECGNRSFLKS